MNGNPKRFKIHRGTTHRAGVLLTLEAVGHGDAADETARKLFNRTFALRMTTWNGRDGVFAAIDDRTGEEKERFFVEAEDGTGRIKQAPMYAPSYTIEDAKKLKEAQRSREITNGKGNGHGKRKAKRR